MIQKLLNIIRFILNGEEDIREDGSYKYVPYDMEMFKKLLPSNKKLFLDVGCGIGDKVMMATEMGYEAHGIEKDERLFRIADKYLFNIKNIDAFDFKDYDKFDVIYMYHPYKDEDKQKELVNLINSKKRKDALFINV